MPQRKDYHGKHKGSQSGLLKGTLRTLRLLSALCLFIYTVTIASKSLSKYNQHVLAWDIRQEQQEEGKMPAPSFTLCSKYFNQVHILQQTNFTFDGRPIADEEERGGVEGQRNKIYYPENSKRLSNRQSLYHLDVSIIRIDFPIILEELLHQKGSFTLAKISIFKSSRYCIASAKL